MGFHGNFFKISRKTDTDPLFIGFFSCYTPYIGGRCHLFVFMKGLDKITGVVETTVQCDFRDRFIGGSQLFAGAFDPVIIQIADRGITGQFLKKTAEIVFVHRDAGCQLFQCHFFCVMIRDKRQDGFKLSYFFSVFESRNGRIPEIVFLDHVSQKRTKQSDGKHLISLFLFNPCLHQRFTRTADEKIRGG